MWFNTSTTRKVATDRWSLSITIPTVTVRQSQLRRKITFGMDLGPRCLATVTTLFIDGNSCIWLQLHSLRCICDFAMPCVYALLQNKSHSVYDELFQAEVNTFEEYGLELNESLTLRRVNSTQFHLVNSIFTYYLLPWVITLSTYLEYLPWIVYISSRIVMEEIFLK